jgi:FkbM family methyltransferase
LHWLNANVGVSETWLDIGAHYGYTAMAMGKLVGPKGRVFTFEPTVSTAGCVSRSTHMNKLAQVTTVPIGLGCPTDLELARISTIRGMADSTLREVRDEVSIFVASFDWLWPRISGGNQRIDGIKIDVQGMEREVVRGMVKSLKTYRPRIACEFHEGVDRAAVLTLLEECGYNVKWTPIGEARSESPAQFLDDCSYEFR